MIFLITGLQGSGKSLFMVRHAVLARLEDKAEILEEERELVSGSLGWEVKKRDFPRLIEYALWLEGEPTHHENEVLKIVSNIPLSGVRYIYLPSPAEFNNLLIKEETGGADILTNCLFLLDEAHIYVDARRSASRLNLKYDFFFDELRKRGNDLLANTQQLGKVDARLRREIDVNIRMGQFDKEEGVAKFHYFYPHTGVKSKKAFMFPGKPFYPFYDTTQRLKKTGKRFRLKAEDLA